MSARGARILESRPVSFGPVPHVSAALKHMRLWVTLVGAALALCFLAHVLLWGFVHFTDAPSERLSPDEPLAQPVIVQNQAEDDAGAADDAPASRSIVEGRMAASRPDLDAAVFAEASEAPEVNVVTSSAGVVMTRLADVVQTVGVAAAIILVLLMLQAVVIAAGASVPGVEMAVTASTWMLIVAALVFPWNGVSSAMAYPGLLQGYESMATASQAQRTGAEGAMPGFVYYGINALLPLLLFGGVAAAVIRFRIGVERGVIVTHASQLDEKIEREIRDRKLGELSTPRAVGALNQAIGVGEVVEPAPAAPPAPLASPPRSPLSARAAEAPAPDEGPNNGRRPI